MKLIYGKKEWLVSCSYNPHRDNISNHLQRISKSLDRYLSQYDHIIIVGDFNTEIRENSMNAFCEKYSLSSLITEPICYTNPANPSCIDFILTNSPCSFENSSIVGDITIIIIIIIIIIIVPIIIITLFTVD